MRTTKLMAGALTLLVLVGGAAAAETVQSSESTVYTLPANVSRIEEYAFYGDGELREIRIPEGVTEIGDYAFANCWYLTEITIPESVTKIGAHAFDSCVSLKTVQLSDNITDLLRIDLDLYDLRSILSDFFTRLCDCRLHTSIHDEKSCFSCTTDRFFYDRSCQSVDLDIHLDRCDTFVCTCYFKVHISKEVF